MILINDKFSAVLIEPLQTDFMLRAVIGGTLAATICAIAGTWVVIRGMAFLGEALGHGMLPGVALATVFGLPLILGAVVSAAAMSTAIGVLQRRGRMSFDTSIGLLFVAMLSIGVIVVSHSRSFATDATTMLFGDILALTNTDLLILCAGLGIALFIAVKFHRNFTAAAFDERIATTLGLRPRLTQVVLVGLVTLAVTASFQAVGTLLVVGLLLAPVVAANRWATRIHTTMCLAAIFGAVSVVGGLLMSWYFGLAAGATIAGTAILIAGLSAFCRIAANRLRATNLEPHAASELSIPEFERTT
ncbi:iron chelate uptake ABC transporter family permease subunit [Glutamicibacter soli]|uniref:Iron chelate uptake ABC transporter family permease subunit n=1 Tax=Glutamicibacter soli TaxID=453836 RepID=A0A6L9G760_9MICC|nr:zinc ABC transporter permease AztB [Glutamicibacter soli]NAZ17049.1 iron chelate uptake ABC transporter family permease subunit [Glutamicibacter soli]